MATVRFLKFAAAIMELLEPGQYLRAAKLQAAVPAIQNNFVSTSQASDVVNVTTEPVAISIQQEAKTCDAIAEHLTEKVTQFDNSKIVIAEPSINLPEIETGLAPKAQLEVDVQSNIEIKPDSPPAAIEIEDTSRNTTQLDLIKSAPQNISNQNAALLVKEAETAAEPVAPTLIMAEPIAQPVISEPALLIKTAAALTDNKPVLPPAPTVIEPTPPAPVISEPSVVEQPKIVETIIAVHTDQIAEKTVACENFVPNDNQKTVVFDTNPVEAKTIEKTSPVNEATIEEEKLPVESNQPEVAPQPAQETVAEPTFNQTQLQYKLNAAQSPTVEPAQSLTKSVGQAAAEPTSFWDLYKDINVSDIKYLSAVRYLYSYMSDRAMLNFLNPAIEVHERQSIMGVVTNMANSNSMQESNVQQIIQKGAEDHEEQLRTQKRDFLENNRRLQTEIQLRQRFERQKFEERILAQKAKEAKE